MSTSLPLAARERFRGFLLTTVRHETHAMRSWVQETHRHDELIWSTAGVMRVHAADSVWTVPSHRAIWVPAGEPHTIDVSSDSVVQATFLADGAAPHLPRSAAVVELPAAVREMLLLNSEAELPSETRLRLQTLAIELLRPSPEAQVDLRMPDSPRLLRIAERIVSMPDASETTEQWASRAGMTSRELSRAFVEETGLSLTQWRIRARVRASLVQLASGRTVVATARSLGYANPSTFIEHFRAIVGCTPAAYFSGDRPRI